MIIDCKKCAWNGCRKLKSAVTCRIPAYWMKKVTAKEDTLGLYIGNWTNKKVTVSAVGCIYYMKMPVVCCPRRLHCSHKVRGVCTYSLPDFIDCTECLTPYFFDICYGEGMHKKEVEILQLSRPTGIGDDFLTRLLKRFIEIGDTPPCVMEDNK